MPMPETGATWPPPQWAPYYAAMRVDDAWYSGDRKRLAKVYGHHAQPTERRRRLWGRKQHRADRRDYRLHVPLPGDIAATSAALLFADMPRIRVGDKDKATQHRLDDLLDAGRVHQTLLGAAEQAAALSGIFLRVTWDRNLISRPLLSAMQPDQAVPEFRHGMLSAVTFWRELSGSTESVVWRHLERHEPGRILHALYLGTRDNIGRAVPLTEHPDTVDLAQTVDKDGATLTLIKGLTAAYVPNMTPNRMHRGSPVGRSDYAAPIYDLFDSIDETWTSWMRDLRLARARLIVPDGYLRNNGPGEGADFDEERELWHKLKIPPNEQKGSALTLAQFAIRVEEHKATAESLTRQAAQAAGYSPQSFGLETDGAAVTATEVDSRDERSDVTRKAKAGHWRHGLGDILHSFLQVDAVHFGSRITPERPNVEFGGATESEQQRATTLDLLARAGAVSTATKVKYLHPEWDDTAVKTEVAAILAETGAGAPDPGDTYPLAA